MNKKYYSLFGFLGPLTALFFIGISIVMSPWFSWSINALSDLGHSVDSNMAPLFNFGLLLSGFFIIFYSILSLRNHAKYTSMLLVVTGLMLQLIATFDELYGSFHFIVSVLFFASLGIASISYVIEKRSILTFVAFVVNIVSWIFYGIGTYSTGISVPEIISSITTTIWIMQSALKIYLNQ